MGFCDKHNMVDFIQKPTGSEEFHPIVDFLTGSRIRYALTANPTIYVSLIEQFWQTTTVETVNDGEQQITVTVDGHKFAITEASIRRHLQLADADGLSSLPNTKIFEQLTLMGVASLEKDLKQTKDVHGKALIKLVKKVKHLEDKLKSTTTRRKARMVISDEEEDFVSEDPSKPDSMTETAYEDIETEYAEVEYDMEQTEQQTTHTKDPQGKEQSQEAFEAELSVLSLFSTAEEIQGKEQISTNKEIAKKLNEEEMAKPNTIVEQVQERQSGSMIRYQTLKKKPVTIAQTRKNMMVYLKNMAGYKMGYFKGMSYDEIRPIFEKEYNKVQTLFKKDTEVEKTTTKRVAEETLLQESFKRLRTAKASSSEPIQEQPTGEPNELSEEELMKMMEIVPVEEIKAEALQVKSTVIDWEIHTEGSRKYWKIIRVSNITKAYQSFKDMLKGFDKEDLDTLWSLVKERFRSAKPTEDMERALWVQLKRLFKPDKEDTL
ncbi:hypothetical protein Tco_0268452 [Tanacetum coccineum]